MILLSQRTLERSRHCVLLCFGKLYQHSGLSLHENEANMPTLPPRTHGLQHRSPVLKGAEIPSIVPAGPSCMCARCLIGTGAHSKPAMHGSALGNMEAQAAASCTAFVAWIGLAGLLRFTRATEFEISCNFWLVVSICLEEELMAS